MINKTNVLQQAEEIIKPLALEHVPQDSDVEAIIDVPAGMGDVRLGFTR